MASKFQKDLYNKRGALFSMWDVCIGLGLSLVLTGLGLKAKDKYLPVRTTRERSDRMSGSTTTRERSDRMSGSTTTRERSDRVSEANSEANTETTKKTHKNSSALSKLGL